MPNSYDFVGGSPFQKYENQQQQNYFQQQQQWQQQNQQQNPQFGGVQPNYGGTPYGQQQYGQIPQYNPLPNYNFNQIQQPQPQNQGQNFTRSIPESGASWNTYLTGQGLPTIPTRPPTTFGQTNPTTSGFQTQTSQYFPLQQYNFNPSGGTMSDFNPFGYY